MTFQGGDLNGVGAKLDWVPKRMAGDEGDTEGQENSFEKSHFKG